MGIINGDSKRVWTRALLCLDFLDFSECLEMVGFGQPISHNIDLFSVLPHLCITRY